LLEALHGRVSTDCGAARARIDAHLLACWLDAKCPDPCLVLAPSDTYHYHNLPDLTRYLRHALAVGDWGENVVSAFMAVYCMQLKKQKRVFERTSLPERTALVNLLHCLLLDLYPYNTRHLPFEHLVRVAGEVRLVFDRGSPLDFILSHEALVQFAVVEYLSNVLSDFCPVEEALLVRGPHFRFSINQVCENFRAAAASAVAASDMWASLNELASAHLPSLFRQLKVSNQKVTRRAVPRRYSPSIAASWGSDGFYERLLDLPVMPITSPNMIAQIKLLCPDMDFLQLQAVEAFWESVFFSVLPVQVVEMQRAILAKHGACSLYQHAAQRLHVCLPCAFRSKGNILAQMFAYNCVEDKVQCAACSRVVIPVNLLGRTLTVRETSYYLCCGCLRPAVWTGNIFECASCRKVPEPCGTATCVACNKKAVEVINKVVDLETLRLTYTPLCFQHAKHCILSKSTVYDTKSLMRDLYNK